MKFLGIVLILVLPLSLQGQIYFKVKSDEIEVKFDDKEVRRTFQFSNKGDYPVTITSIKTSCGCTTAAMEKMNYLAGEEGAIEAIFNIGQREGLQRKIITIFTDDPDYPYYELMLVVNIPKIAEINTRLLFWHKNERMNPKTITIDFQPESPINITDIENSNDSFNLDLKEIESGKKYALTVDPGTMRTSKSSKLLVKTDFPKDNPKLFYFHLRVQ